MKSEKIFSRWWIIAICVVLIYGFAVLITVTCKAYRDKPPVPELVVDEYGNPLFSGQDIRDGQALFLRYGLMDNGSIWGHGAYLGPDFSAAYLHDLALNYEKKYADIEKRTAVAKTNRYDKDSGILIYNDVECKTLFEAPQRWGEYFKDPKNNGGLKADLITDTKELCQLSAYFSWAAWATIATRPGSKESYTNNFPYEPLLSNSPGTDTFVWSGASLLFLLFGIGGCLWFVGRNPRDHWSPNDQPYPMAMPDGNSSNFNSSRAVFALLKFCAVVGLLFLGQTLIGGAVAHYRADPSSFYGWDMSTLWPSDLMRTWHLQLAIFWIATGFVIGGLILSRSLGGRDWRGLVPLINLLFAAFALVIFGSCLAEWAGISGWWNNATFWLGSQGWEYIELGRAWQYALIVGLLVWAAVIIRNVMPVFKAKLTPDATFRERAKKPLTVVFLISAIAIPVFYLPAIFFGSHTNFTVVDTWRFWVIHLWVEGFFETFATVMVALVFMQLGLVSRIHGLRIIFLDIIVTLMGGIIGTGHHWYFEGQTYFNMAVSSCFSAMEVVPLVLLTIEAAGFMRTSRESGLPGVAQHHKWTLNYFMAVGVWNFVGAGVFGFLINMPIVSYYEIGTMLTPNHGHAAMFGVFGFLALGLTVFAMRKNFNDADWEPIAKLLKVAFWGLNIGLFLMLAMSLLPGGFVQLYDSFTNGYWHCRELSFSNGPTMSMIGWLRIAGDLIFIFAGALPFFCATLLALYKGYKNRKERAIANRVVEEILNED